MEVKHYIQKVNSDGTLISGTLKDLEVDFSGLLYSKAEGLLAKGKRKDIHTETYADSDTLRVWQGTNVTREATTITFTFYFKGDNRQKVYDNFYEYIKNGVIAYWDTARMKEARLVLIDALEPSDDLFKGSTPYISANFKFQNLWGECKDKKQ